jgi:hypothetical protein
MVRVAIKESIWNETGKIRRFTRSNNPFIRQSHFQNVRSNFGRGVEIQNLSDRFKKADLIRETPLNQCALSFLKQIEVRWRDIKGIRWMREPL